MAITMAYVPQAMIGWWSSLMVDPWIRLIGLIPLAIGAVFLYSASRFRGTLYLRIIGAISLLKGVFFVIAPLSLSRSLMAWFLEFPVWALRLSAIVSLAMALAVAVLVIISLFDEDII